MNDYTKKIQNLPNEAIEKIEKTIEKYTDDYSRKERFIECYHRQRDYLTNGKLKLLNIEEVNKAFKAKDFFKNLLNCGSWLEFRHYKKTNQTKLHHANFCKRDRLCIPCAVRRAYKQQNRFMQIIEQDKTFLQKDWYYVVIPVKHTKKETYETVMNRVIKLRKQLIASMNNSRKGKHNNFWAYFGGGMYSQEVTKTDNGWNVHLNLILNAEKGVKIPLKAIKNRRGQVSTQNGDLRAWLIKHYDSQIHNISQIKDNNNLRGDLVEVLKYSLKFSSLSQQELFYVFVKSVGVRLFGAFGNMYGKGLENVELEGDTAPDEDFEKLIFYRTFGELGLQYNLYKREMRNREKEFQEYNKTLVLDSGKKVQYKEVIYKED